MKIRALPQLQIALDANLSWRKQELTAQYFIVANSKSINQKVSGRAAIVMLYSHWEGFTKDACKAYASFLSNQTVSMHEWSDKLLTSILHNELNAIGSSRQHIDRYKTVQKIRNSKSSPSQPLKFSSKGATTTRSNLNGKNTRNLFASLNLNFSAIALSEKPVIEQLVKYRHSIAHGGGIPIDPLEYRDLHHNVIDLLDLVHDQILDAASNKTYLC